MDIVSFIYDFASLPSSLPPSLPPPSSLPPPLPPSLPPLQNGLSSNSLSSINGPTVDGYSTNRESLSQDPPSGPPASSSANYAHSGHSGSGRKKVSAPPNMQPHLVRLNNEYGTVFCKIVFHQKSPIVRGAQCVCNRLPEVRYCVLHINP